MSIEVTVARPHLYLEDEEDGEDGEADQPHPDLEDADPQPPQQLLLTEQHRNPGPLQQCPSSQHFSSDNATLLNTSQIMSFFFFSKLFLG